MDFGFQDKNGFRGGRFGSVTGTIVDMVPARMGGRRSNGCIIYVTMEDMDGNTVVFLLAPTTYVVDFDTLSVGMRCTFWYLMDAPMVLIYPPQYNAVAAAQEENGRMVNVAYYDNDLVNDTQTLQLNLDANVDVRTINNQYFQGSPANHNLVVTYDNSTRSIPAQTTPRKVVVLCD